MFFFRFQNHGSKNLLLKENKSPVGREGPAKVKSKNLKNSNLKKKNNHTDRDDRHND